MSQLHRMRNAELQIACLVAAAIAVTGIFDFSHRSAPSGVFDLHPSLGLGLFLAACLGSALMAVRLVLLGHSTERSAVRLALLLVCLVPVLLADPTYASLMMVIPLLDSRRRDDPQTRALWTTGIVGVVALVLFTEDTQSATNDFETLLVLVISFVVVILLGNALRELDAGLSTQAELAKLYERSRLAEELHDGLGHHLLASSVQLQTAKALRGRDPDASAVAVERALQAIKEAIYETRLVVDSSRNDEVFALEPSIRDLVQRIVPAGTEMGIRISGDHSRLGSRTQVAVYRVVQEALTNLVRHASATQASIESTAEADSVTVSISDNGAGFDVEAVALPGGLSNMRRRVEQLGGSFTIDSAMPGTIVTASMPL